MWVGNEACVQLRLVRSREGSRVAQRTSAGPLLELLRANDAARQAVLAQQDHLPGLLGQHLPENPHKILGLQVRPHEQKSAVVQG